jgi:hypothetical protein
VTQDYGSSARQLSLPQPKLQLCCCTQLHSLTQWLVKCLPSRCGATQTYIHIYLQVIKIQVTPRTKVPLTHSRRHLNRCTYACVPQSQSHSHSHVAAADLLAWISWGPNQASSTVRRTHSNSHTANLTRFQFWSSSWTAPFHQNRDHTIDSQA